MAQQPKKPTGGAFGQFLNKNRAAFSQECSGKQSAVVKLAGERFKALEEAEKAQFQEKFKEAMEQYNKDMEAFLAAGGEKKAQKRKAKEEDKDDKKRQKKDPNAPKTAGSSAYGCFLNANRATFEKACEGKPASQIASEISKMAKEQWKKLSAEDKKPFEEEHKTKKAAHAEAMKIDIPPESETPSKTSSITQELPEQDSETPAKTKAKAATGKRATSKGPKAAKAKGPEAIIELVETVAKAAEKAGLRSQLIKLLSRQDIIGSGKSQTAVWKALQESNGLIHPAKRALLGV